ncbi:LmbU family transcriptional regulator [Umezawaea sp. NPDC059074]|uniref:LmbU family transcriptional regulator n=1 Tax=Umezawaea sp. NPDC059074 TaxID=3346716 RepID=UPI0036859045
MTRARRSTVARSAVGVRGSQEHAITFTGKVIATNVGLHFPDNLSYSAWIRAGQKVARIANSSAWFTGDWLACGQVRYADQYREAAKAVGLEYQTVRNYAWVARRFPIERRRENLSFQHHAEVASLAPCEQDRLLAAAERAGWSRNELRTQVQCTRQSGKPVDVGPVVQPLKVDRRQVDRWMRAANHAGVSLESWMIGCLDKAASSELTAAAEPAASAGLMDWSPANRTSLSYTHHLPPTLKA